MKKPLFSAIVTAIRPMQQPRNKAAHAASLKIPEIDRLYADKATRDLSADFPRSFEKSVANVQSRLQELEQLPGFAASAEPGAAADSGA